jgi:hypothetical protein
MYLGHSTEADFSVPIKIDRVLQSPSFLLKCVFPERRDAPHWPRSPVGGGTYFAGADLCGGAEALQGIVSVRSQPLGDASGDVVGAVGPLQLIPCALRDDRYDYPLQACVERLRLGVICGLARFLFNNDMFSATEPSPRLSAGPESPTTAT